MVLPCISGFRPGAPLPPLHLKYHKGCLFLHQANRHGLGLFVGHRRHLVDDRQVEVFGTKTGAGTLDFVQAGLELTSPAGVWLIGGDTHRFHCHRQVSLAHV